MTTLLYSATPRLPWSRTPGGSQSRVPLLELHHKGAARGHPSFFTRLRMALRDQLRFPAVATHWEKDYFSGKDWTVPDARALAGVCLGVHDLESARFLKGYLDRVDESFPNVERECHYIARYGPEEAGTWVLHWMQQKYPQNIAYQGQLMKTVQQAAQERGKPLGATDVALAETLAIKLLASPQVPLGIELAGLFKFPKTQEALVKVVDNPKANKNVRKSAVVALVAIDPKGNTAALARLISSPTEAIEVREQIANSLAGTNSPDAHAVLVKALETAPARLQTTIAMGLAGSRAGGEKLLEAVALGKASARLLQEAPIGIRLSQAKIPNLSERVAKLTKGLPTADQRVQSLLNQRRDGYLKAEKDARVGLKVYEKHCAACHQIANQGAKIGPQLDGVGIRGLERLLEDTLDPNRNVDQAFRTTTLVLANGQLMSGLLLRQDGTVLVLADNAGKEVRVPAGDVQERVLSPLSPMPGNFAEQISEPEFYHLLAYLLAQRTKD